MVLQAAMKTLSSTSLAPIHQFKQRHGGYTSVDKECYVLLNRIAEDTVHPNGGGDVSFEKPHIYPFDEYVRNKQNNPKNAQQDISEYRTPCLRIRNDAKYFTRMESTAAPAANVKQEPRADDDEINQLAARMVEQHRQKAAQQALHQQQLQSQRPQQQQQQQQRQRTAGQANITSYFAGSRDSSQPKQTTPEPSPDLLDTDSVRLRFGWSVVGTHPLPCLFRKGERFCPVRAVEKMILSSYLQKLPMDVCNCTSIKSYFVTENEAKLLNEINYRHCDYFYGREAFTPKDCIVRVEDAKQFADFLALCERKMVNMQSKPDDRCGFLRINGESVVPFTIKRIKVNAEKRDVRFVPLFYFEGETEHLKHKAEQLTGWDLAYLKLCCKVQGIRSELFQSDTCDVVSLDDVKRHFPSGTQFQTWWPIKRFEFKLTNQPKPSFWECQPPPSSSQVTPVSTAASRVAVSRQATTPAVNGSAQLASRSQVAQWASGRLGTTLQQQQLQQLQQQRQQQQQQQQQQLQHRTSAAAVTNAVNTTYAQLLLTNGVNIRGPSTTVLTAVNGQLRQPTMSQAVSGSQRLTSQTSLPHGYQAVMNPQMFAQMQQQMSSAVSAYTTPSVPRQEGSLSSGPSPRPASAVPNGRQAPPLLPMSAAKRPAPGGDPQAVDLSRSSLDVSRLLQMPRPQFRPPPSNLDPFIAQKRTIENRSVPCINGVAHDFTVMYVSLHDLVKHVFPKVPVRSFQEILAVLGIYVFKASSDHLVALSLSGSAVPLDSIVGLVRLNDLITFMPQIGYMCESESAKRLRAS